MGNPPLDAASNCCWSSVAYNRWHHLINKEFFFFFDNFINPFWKVPSGKLKFTLCYYTHGSEIHTCTSAQTGPEQLGVRCLAHGHLSSAQEVNWHLFSYQSTLHIEWSELDLNQRPSGSQAKSPRTKLLPPLRNQRTTPNLSLCTLLWLAVKRSSLFAHMKDFSLLCGQE